MFTLQIGKFDNDLGVFTEKLKNRYQESIKDANGRNILERAACLLDYDFNDFIHFLQINHSIH